MSWGWAVAEDQTLANFLYVESGFDPVSVETAISCPRSLGLTNCVLTFFAHGLSGCFCGVKHGSSLNSYHTVKVGLPQGTVISPIPFNVVVATTFNLTHVLGPVISTTVSAEPCIYLNVRKKYLPVKTCYPGILVGTLQPLWVWAFSWQLPNPSICPFNGTRFGAMKFLYAWVSVTVQRACPFVE